MEGKENRKRYPEVMPLSEASKDSFASFIRDVFLESPEAMWYEKLPSEKELEGLFTAKLEGCNEGSVIDLVFSSGEKLLCEVEIVRVNKERAVVGIITRSEGMGTGISDMLLRSAEEKAKESNIKELIAEVKKKNKRAIEFFKRNGYVEIGDNEELATLVKRI